MQTPGPSGLKLAAGILALDDRGRVLAVSRGVDDSDWGLPFGGADEGEEAEAAAVRELFEETGLQASGLTRVFEQQSRSRWAVTFLAARVDGVLTSSGEGVAEWVDFHKLTAMTSRHHAYNRALLRVLLLRLR